MKIGLIYYIESFHDKRSHKIVCQKIKSHCMNMIWWYDMKCARQKRTERVRAAARLAAVMDRRRKYIYFSDLRVHFNVDCWNSWKTDRVVCFVCVEFEGRVCYELSLVKTWIQKVNGCIFLLSEERIWFFQQWDARWHFLLVM